MAPVSLNHFLSSSKYHLSLTGLPLSLAWLHAFFIILTPSIRFHSGQTTSVPIRQPPYFSCLPFLILKKINNIWHLITTTSIHPSDDDFWRWPILFLTQSQGQINYSIDWKKAKRTWKKKKRQTFDQNAKGSFWNLHTNFWDNVFFLGVWFPGCGGGTFCFMNHCLWSDLTTGEFLTLEMVVLIL